MMRKIAFGYSTRCNIRCGHCVAAGEVVTEQKMDLGRAKQAIRQLEKGGVTGISFTAGEPFIYFEDLLELVDLCRQLNIYTRVVTNSFWAKSDEKSLEKIFKLKEAGLCQLRLSYSRWHQKHVPQKNIFYAAQGCKALGIDYYVSFVTDFSEEDENYEQFLRDSELKFFPEPVIYAGRAESFGRPELFTDYQENRCSMNPYLAPNMEMYACCDAGSHFTTTQFFLLGNLNSFSADQLFKKSEKSVLYNCIRSMGITNIASFAGVKSRDIVGYRKCELCKKLFDSPEMLLHLQTAASGDLLRWVR